MVTDFTKSIVADIRRINIQLEAKQAELRELLGLFRLELMIAREILRRAALAIAMGVRVEQFNNFVQISVSIAITAGQIEAVRQEITALRRELAFDVGRLRGA